MPPPVDVCPEIRKQPSRRREAIRAFRVAQMPVVALAGLVVVSKDAPAGNNVGQRKLVGVPRSPHGSADSPDAQLCEGIDSELMAFSKQKLGFRVGLYSNRESVVKCGGNRTPAFSA